MAKGKTRSAQRRNPNETNNNNNRHHADTVDDLSEDHTIADSFASVSILNDDFTGQFLSIGSLFCI